MSDSSKLWRTVLLCSCVFCAALTVSALVGRMIITDTVYSPVAPDLTAVSLRDAASLLAKAAGSSSLQTALIFLSGFSTLALPTAAAVSLYRGAALGYAAAVVSRGALVGSSGAASGMREMSPVFILYFLSGVAVIFFSAVAVSHSERICHPARRSMTRGYLLQALTLSGAVFAADILKLLFI